MPSRVAAAPIRPQDHEAQPARPDFLVPAGRGQQLGQGQRRAQPAGQTVGGEDRLDPADFPGADGAQTVGKLRRGDQADRDRLAMQVDAVAGNLLDRVGEGVPEVEQRPAPFGRQLALVRRDDGRLDRAAPPDHGGQLGARRPQRRALDGGEKLGVAEQARLDHLGHAGGELPAGQRGEQAGGDVDPARLVERADQVLAGREVDPGLAADGAVHHRQQARRHLVVVDAAQVARGGETGEIPDHPAADREHRGPPVQAGRREKIQDPAEFGQRLRGLAGRRDPDRRPAEHGAHGRPLALMDVRVGDHHHLAAGGGQPLRLGAHRPGQIGPKANRVRALGQGDGEILDHESRTLAAAAAGVNPLRKRRPGAAQLQAAACAAASRRAARARQARRTGARTPPW